MYKPSSNFKLCREIEEIILSENIPIWQIADIFNLLPELLLDKLHHGKIKPTVYQLILFIETTRKPLNYI